MIYDDLKTNYVQDIIGLKFDIKLFILFIQFYLVVNPSNEFIALHDLVSFGLCYKYLYDLFSKESINKINRLTQEMIDKARDVCKLTKVSFFVYLFYFIYFI